MDLAWDHPGVSGHGCMPSIIQNTVNLYYNYYYSQICKQAPRGAL